jgi:hypothetical protein
MPLAAVTSAFLVPGRAPGARKSMRAKDATRPIAGGLVRALLRECMDELCPY